MPEDFLKNPLALFDIKGKTAIVTGASGAFGALAAKVLAGAGANVTTRTGSSDGATLVLTGNTATSSIVNFTTNNSVLTLKAPTTGWSAGIAVWEPNTGKNFSPINQLGQGNSTEIDITGVFYAPNATVQFDGNTATSPTCTQIIAKSVVFSGNRINFKGECGEGWPNGVPGVKTFGQIIALVE